MNNRNNKDYAITNEDLSHDYILTENIWDEITKAIVEKMPHQLLPLIEEVFHKQYPFGVTVKLLSTEYITPNMNKEKRTHLNHILSDITVLVNDKDIYHLECEMTNNKEMVVRMMEYDFHIALVHSKYYDSSNIPTIEFPRSVVMYPGTNSKIPDKLTCNIRFSDGTHHIYEIPTVKVQKYSLEDIRSKHLTIFVPFKLISFRKRLNSKTNPIQENELTEYVNKIILILEDEVRLGNLSPSQFRDYVKLIDYSAKRVFHKHRKHQEEVFNVTKSVLSLPSDEIEELHAALNEKDIALNEKDIALNEKDVALIEKDNLIEQLISEINELKSKA